jgi:hypothetical protein
MILVAILKVTDESRRIRSSIRIRIRGPGSVPYQNVMDPQHWFSSIYFFIPDRDIWFHHRSIPDAEFYFADPDLNSDPVLDQTVHPHIGAKSKWMQTSIM